MKDKAIFKKWWFWAIVVIVLGAIGAATQSSSNTNTNSTNHPQTADSKGAATLPRLNADDHKGKEGLVVYKDLQGKGYKVEAVFEKQALTDINGKASDVFEPLDPNKTEDRQSVDAFVVGDVTQDGDNVKLTIVQAQNS